MNPARGNILIIDDNTENLSILVETLGAEGYTVRPALNGIMGLESARKVKPDLILLDIIMPDMNGYQILNHLQNDPDLKNIPVIFISALNEIRDKVKGFAAGSVDYITKPFQAEEVLARVETHLLLNNLRKDLRAKNSELEKANQELQKALNEIKSLRGILPICGFCKKIRDDKGYWERLETYISDHSEAEFSHGVCPKCARKHYPDIEIYPKSADLD